MSWMLATVHDTRGLPCRMRRRPNWTADPAKSAATNRRGAPSVSTSRWTNSPLPHPISSTRDLWNPAGVRCLATSCCQGLSWAADSDSTLRCQPSYASRDRASVDNIVGRLRLRWMIGSITREDLYDLRREVGPHDLRGEAGRHAARTRTEPRSLRGVVDQSG